MAAVRFTVGDRVRTRIPTPFVRVGTPGTIWRVFASTRKAYSVQFDSHPSPWLMWADELEYFDDVPQFQAAASLL